MLLLACYLFGIYLSLLWLGPDCSVFIQLCPAVFPCCLTFMTFSCKVQIFFMFQDPFQAPWQLRHTMRDVWEQSHSRSAAPESFPQVDPRA